MSTCTLNESRAAPGEPHRLTCPVPSLALPTQTEKLYVQPKLSGGKRGPSAPLVTTSDEDDSDHSPNDGDPAPDSVEYENVASPDNSSTASGPIYVRPPGFEHHGQEIARRPKLKKKKTGVLCTKDGILKRDPTPPKTKPRRVPLPMRLRALPQSFWQQPNVPHNVSPAQNYPILPPLHSKVTDEDVSDIRPITPPEEREEREQKKRPPRPPDRRLTLANTDLLFKLFDVMEDKKSKGKGAVGFKRGRPRKADPASHKTLLMGEDPYLVDAMSAKLFPQLTLSERIRHPVHMGGGGATLQLITIREGDRSVTLPSLGVDQNYPQMLSELVMHI